MGDLLYMLGWCLPAGRQGTDIPRSFALLRAGQACTIEVYIIKIRCMYIIYALKSIHYNYIYVWMISNLSRRIQEHNTWKTKSTSYYKPFDLLYKEEVEDRIQARIREKYRKSWIGKEKLKAMVV